MSILITSVAVLLSSAKLLRQMEWSTSLDNLAWTLRYTSQLHWLCVFACVRRASVWTLRYTSQLFSCIGCVCLYACGVQVCVCRYQCCGNYSLQIINYNCHY